MSTAKTFALVGLCGGFVIAGFVVVVLKERLDIRKENARNARNAIIANSNAFGNFQQSMQTAVLQLNARYDIANPNPNVIPSGQVPVQAPINTDEDDDLEHDDLDLEAPDEDTESLINSHQPLQNPSASSALSVTAVGQYPMISLENYGNYLQIPPPAHFSSHGDPQYDFVHASTYEARRSTSH